MELIAKTAVICIVVSLTALLLQRDTPELALLLTLGAVTVVMLFALSFYEEVQAIFAAVWQQSGLDGALFAPILKIIAISLVTRLGADVCKDSGQGALASLVDMAGVFCALLTAEPLFSQAWGILTQLGGWG